MEGNTLKKNNQFRQQLFTAFRDGHLPITTFERLNYNRKDLVRVFTVYNGDSQKKTIKKTNRKYFGLSAKMSYQISTIAAQRAEEVFTFDNLSAISLGCELEYFLPINKNKWSVILSPSYYSYQASTAVKYNQQASLDYNTLDLPIGIRHSFYINNDSRLFISAAYEFSYCFNSYMQYGRDITLNLSAPPSILLNIGYNRKRLRAEINYGFNRNLMYKYVYWTYDYSYLNLGIAYTLWKN